MPNIYVFSFPKFSSFDASSQRCVILKRNSLIASANSDQRQVQRTNTHLEFLRIIACSTCKTDDENNLETSGYIASSTNIFLFPITRVKFAKQIKIPLTHFLNFVRRHAARVFLKALNHRLSGRSQNTVSYLTNARIIELIPALRI